VSEQLGTEKGKQTDFEGCDWKSIKGQRCREQLYL